MNLRTITPLVLGAALVAASAAPAATIEGKVTVVGAKNNADAVVWVQGDMEGSAPAKTAVMDQKGMTFVPHVLPIETGTTVEFKNSDSVGHNVFTPDKCAGQFNLGTWSKGEVRTHTFDKPCKAVILCAIHPEMEAWIIAVPSAHFAVTDADGHFEIDGVSPGQHTLEVWHPKAGQSSQQVTVDGTTEISLRVGK